MNPAEATMELQVPARSSALARAREKLSELVSTSSAHELSISATLLTLVLYTPKLWYAKAPILVLAVLACLIAPLRASKVLWFSCVALCGGYVIFDYHSADNHKFLLCYWALAIFLGLHGKNPAVELARSARLLIALCMSLAVLWKLASYEYLSGQFFAHELLFDGRFRSVTRVLTGMTQEMFEANKAALDNVRAGVMASAPFELTPRVMSLAKGMSWFGLALEFLIALAFILPSDSKLGRFRDVPLQVFLLTVYPIATVMGFAYLLAAMGIAQARSRAAVVIYVAVLAFMQLFTMKWGLFL